MSHYRIGGKIASGGAASVYRAVRDDGVIVALKRPHPHLFEDPSAASALRREIEVARRLRHPNVVALYDVLEEDAGPALVLEHIEGLSLAELVRAWQDDASPPTTALAALSLVRDVALGLAAVHELRGETGELLGLVHRDVSPQNVLVGLDGRARLTDFGLARSVARGDRSTTGGVLKGKAGYLAPEYIRGAPIDCRLDIFALGVVLWESLTRHRLFAAENEAATLQRILEMRPPPLAVHGVDFADDALEQAVEAVVQRATARAPRDRFASAREMVAALDACLLRSAVGDSAAAVVASFGPSVQRTVQVRSGEATGETSVSRPLLSVVYTRAGLRHARWPFVAGMTAVAGVVLVLGLSREHPVRAQGEAAPSPPPSFDSAHDPVPTVSPANAASASPPSSSPLPSVAPPSPPSPSSSPPGTPRPRPSAERGPKAPRPNPY